jgi:hypothetical protein
MAWRYLPGGRSLAQKTLASRGVDFGFHTRGDPAGPRIVRNKVVKGAIR